MDNGSEFVSKIMEDYCDSYRGPDWPDSRKNKGISLVFSSAYAPQSNGAIEKLNMTLKYLLQKNIILNKDYNWVTNLPKLLEAVHNTSHVGLNNQTPQDIESKINDEEFIQTEAKRQRANKKETMAKSAFKVGDQVRIHMPSDKFKSYQWTKKLYKIVMVYRPKQKYGVFEFKIKSLDPKADTKEEKELEKKRFLNEEL